MYRSRRPGPLLESWRLKCSTSAKHFNHTADPCYSFLVIGSHSARCPSCNADLTGRYCGNCGESAVHAGDLKLSHLSHDFWHEFTHVDGKIWGSFLTLLFKPGQLTKDYWEGRRGKWMRPVRMFLIITALSLLLAPESVGPLGLKVWATKTASSRTLITLGQSPPVEQPRTEQPSPGVHVSIGGAATRSLMSFETDELIPDAEVAELNEKIRKSYKVLQYAGLAIFALVSLWIGRAAQPYYGAHLIFALHYYGFQYILNFVLIKIHANPEIALFLSFFYLIVAVWKLMRGGRAIPRALGLDWGSVWRAVVLTVAVSIGEVIAMSAAGAIAMRMPGH